MPSRTTLPATSRSSTPLTERTPARRLLLPVVTGLLLAAAFPPLDLGPLVLVAPIPLLASWRRAEGPGPAARDGLLAGAVFFGVLLVWVWHFGVVAYFPFVAVLAAYWAGAGAVVGSFARRGVTSPWVVASVWVVFEALRGRWPLGGFSWGELGYATHDMPVLRSLAGWGGVLLVSFVIVLVAGYALRLPEWWRRERGTGAARAVAVLGVATAVVVGAHVALPRTDPTGDVRVAVVQGNDRNRHLTAAEVANRYLPRSHFDLARELDPGDFDLVVFPESSLDADPRDDLFLGAGLADAARRLDASLLANAAVEIDDGTRLENTNFYYDARGRLVGTYLKQHLVPFGEYVPARSLLGFVEELEQIPLDYVAGGERQTFEAAGVPFGNLICFESAFTEIARGYVRDGAEVLVVSTNNRSFRRSANAAQHVAIGQIRAVETGRPVVHAAVSGRSAFIDVDGDVVASTGLFERTVLERTVTGRTGRTPYVVLGDWILLAAAGVMLTAAWRVRGRQFARIPADS